MKEKEKEKKKNQSKQLLDKQEQYTYRAVTVAGMLFTSRVILTHFPLQLTTLKGPYLETTVLQKHQLLQTPVSINIEQ